MAYYKNLQHYIDALDRAGLLYRVKRSINKDTEMHPLVRWQFRGLREEERRAFYFEAVCDSKGKKYDIPVLVGGLAGWIASGIMKVNTGLLLNIVLGILGAIVLNALLIAIFHATWGGIIGQLVVGLLGACILIALGRAIRR